MSFECLDCKAIGDGYCSDCATPNDELRELVEEWNEDVEHYRRMRGSDGRRAGILERCADELEEVLGDE